MSISRTSYRHHSNSCQKKIDNSNTKTIISITDVKYNTVGFSDKYDTLSNLNFQEINKKEFDKLKKNNDVFVQTPIEKKGIIFFLDINNKTLQLRGKNEKKADRGEDKSEIWYSYLGFYPSLNMYAVLKQVIKIMLKLFLILL